MSELDIPAVSKICEAIVQGKYDQAQMDGIVEAVVFRRKQLVPFIHVGDLVKFNERTKPTYLVGTAGKVIKVNSKRVEVQLDHPIGRFGSRIMSPKSLLEVTKSIYDQNH